MHHATQKFYEAFAPEEKNDFYGGYLYLKYINRFAAIACKSLNLPYKEIVHEDLGPLEDGIAEMLEAYTNEIAEMSQGGAETDIYHAKVVKFLDAIQLVSQKEDMHLKLSEQVVPWKVARDVILENPTSIAVGPCGCRLNSDKPCGEAPYDYCIIVGDPGADFIAELNPKFHHITPEEAEKILEESHKRGDIHCAYFKREIANRFFAICNCCSCCCMGVKMWNMIGGIQGAKDVGDLVFLVPSGYVAKVDTDACVGCEACADLNNFDCITMDDDDHAVVNTEKCMGCGGCEGVCPEGAISLHLDPSKGEPLDIDNIRKKLNI